MEENKVKKPKRSEEIQHIIDRMPTKFSGWITLIIVFILSSIFAFGWLISYNDVVVGQITVGPNNPPVKLVANLHGRIRLFAKDQQYVHAGDYLALIQNSTNVSHLKHLSTIIADLNVADESQLFRLRDKLIQNKYSLGELNYKFYQFLMSLNSRLNYNIDGAYEKQEEMLANQLHEYEKMQASMKARSGYNSQNVEIYNKFFQRDSLLKSKDVISDVEFERSGLSYIGALSSKEDALYQISELSQQIESTRNRLDLLRIEKDEKDIQLKIELASAFADLKDNIRLWEEKYILKAPVDGRVQFLKFWHDSQFVQSGEAVLTVVPSDKKNFAQLSLPNAGSAKVRKGQEVIIKLDDYPYMEYGSLKGTVRGISLTTNTSQTQTGVTENYLINVELPSTLLTNYNVKIENKHEIKGTAEIIANERRLIERLFDNLRYLASTK